MRIIKFFVFFGSVALFRSDFFGYVAGQIALPMPAPMVLPGAVPPQSPTNFKSKDTDDYAYLSSASLVGDESSGDLRAAGINLAFANVKDVSATTSSVKTSSSAPENATVQESPRSRSVNPFGGSINLDEVTLKDISSLVSRITPSTAPPTEGTGQKIRRGQHPNGHPWRKTRHYPTPKTGSRRGPAIPARRRSNLPPRRGGGTGGGGGGGGGGGKGK